jgi:hypothetical protein
VRLFSHPPALWASAAYSLISSNYRDIIKETVSGRLKMTEGINPRTGKWNKSIEISLGKRAKRDPESKTMRMVQKMLKPKKRS